MTGKRVPDATRLGRIGDVPEQNRRVQTSGGHDGSLGGKRYRIDHVAASCYWRAETARANRIGHVPQQHIGIRIRGGHGVSVRSEGYFINVVGASGEQVSQW